MKQIFVLAVALLGLAAFTPKAQAFYLPTDQCPNLSGFQLFVPVGYHKADGQCVPDVIEEPTDYCPTLEGVQAEDVDCPQGEETPPVIIGDEAGDDNCHVGEVDDFTAKTGTPGDGIIEIDWSLVSGAAHVKIQYSLDSFRHSHSVIVDDDGHHRLRHLANEEYSVRMWGSGHDCRGKKTKAAVLTP